MKDNLGPHSARYIGYLIRALPGGAVNDDGRLLAARPAHAHQRQLPRCSAIILDQDVVTGADRPRDQLLGVEGGGRAACLVPQAVRPSRIRAHPVELGVGTAAHQVDQCQGIMDRAEHRLIATAGATFVVGAGVEPAADVQDAALADKLSQDRGCVGVFSAARQ